MTDVFRPLRTSSLMPPYRAVMAVDTEKYTRTSSLHQQLLSGTMLTVLEEAFRRSDLAELWHDASFPQSTGDGYVIGVAPEYLPFLVHPLLGYLQEVLEEAQPALASQDRQLRLRLRASIELGPLPDSGGEATSDGIGRAMNDTHRLLDSKPVRAGLSHSDPDITLLAAIISRRVYEDAILGGFVGLNERRFSPVDVQIPEKEYAAEAYIYIPQPSANSTPTGVESGNGGQETAVPGKSVGEPVAHSPVSGDKAPVAPSSNTTDPPSVVNRVGHNAKGVVQGGTITDGVHIGDNVESTEYTGIGKLEGDVGTVITDPKAPVNSGSGTQFNNSGDATQANGGSATTTSGAEPASEESE
ncbi:hypothetical protein [Salinactinospora qingdaonensis]|uniref:Uncharacterized protein n=1 Tax=Salinactinospora qingdaonensis TaxID=702744 RepID=A0ABP7G2A2_9ACTN